MERLLPRIAYSTRAASCRPRLTACIDGFTMQFVSKQSLNLTRSSDALSLTKRCARGRFCRGSGLRNCTIRGGGSRRSHCNGKAPRVRHLTKVPRPASLVALRMPRRSNRLPLRTCQAAPAHRIPNHAARLANSHNLASCFAILAATSSKPIAVGCSSLSQYFL